MKLIGVVALWPLLLSLLIGQDACKLRVTRLMGKLIMGVCCWLRIYPGRRRYMAVSRAQLISNLVVLMMLTRVILL